MANFKDPIHHRRDLRSVLKQNPEIIVTNKPEIVMAILQGQKAQ